VSAIGAGGLSGEAGVSEPGEGGFWGKTGASEAEAGEPSGEAGVSDTEAGGLSREGGAWDTGCIDPPAHANAIAPASGARTRIPITGEKVLDTASTRVRTLLQSARCPRASRQNLADRGFGGSSGQAWMDRVRAGLPAAASARRRREDGEHDQPLIRVVANPVGDALGRDMPEWA
jgi:hypothetical protein